MLDLDKLLRNQEGKTIPEDMRPWFTLAREARKIQKELEAIDDNILRLQAELRRAEEARKYQTETLNHLLHAMNQVLPKGVNVEDEFSCQEV